MTEQIVPNTDTHVVAAIAVAWEIVKVTQDIGHMNGSREEKLKEITNAVIQAYVAIWSQTPIK
jgi:hypothetical protein